MGCTGLLLPGHTRWVAPSSGSCLDFYQKPHPLQHRGFNFFFQLLVTVQPSVESS